MPIVGALFSGPPIGIGMLTAGHRARDHGHPVHRLGRARRVQRRARRRSKESAVALGSTRWEILSRVTLPYTRSAIIGAIFLGLGRALGETMAVTFVLGNAHDLSASLLMPSNSIAAAIANEFTEADTELYRSSLIALGFLLFVVTFIVLTIAKLMLMRIGRTHGRTQLMAIAAAPQARRHPRASLFAGGSDAVRAALAGLDPVDHAQPGRRRAVARAVHPDDAAARRERRPAQRLLRKRGDDPARVGDRHAGRHRRRHLPRRAWPPHAPRRRRQLRQRHPAERAVDRDRPVRLRAGGPPVRPFLRASPARSRWR